MRIQEEGAVYHVISRGILKQNIFRDESDKAYFLRLLREGAERYLIDVFAYCLMDNHYHMSLRISKENLSEFMHFLGSSYANYLVRNGWVGHVFAGRFKSIRIAEEEYLVIANRYIHLNPVEAGIVDRPEKYVWSNYGSCVNGGKERWLEEDWLEEYFGPGRDAARERYRHFVEGGDETGSCYPENEVVARALLGSDKFIRRIKAYIRDGKWAEEVAGHKELTRIASLEEVYHAVCYHLGFSDLEQGDYASDREYHYVCSLLIHMAGEYTAASCRDIAGKLGGISENALSHRRGALKKRLSKDGELRARIDADKKAVLEMIEGRVVSPGATPGLGVTPGNRPDLGVTPGNRPNQDEKSSCLKEQQ